MFRSLVAVGTLWLCLSHGVAFADQWPNWRGVNNDGLCAESHVPYEWSRTKNIAWKLPLPGAAGATPVVWDNRIYLTSTGDDGQLLLLAVSENGKELWRKTVAEGNKEVRGGEGNSAAPSPVTDGQHVWAFFANGVLGCFAVNGTEVWKINVQDRYGKFDIQFGLTSTPVLDHGILYQQLIHGDGDVKTQEARVIALEAATGREIWNVSRPSDAFAENEHSYASPIMYQDGQQKFLLTHGADFIVAHDLKDGHELWRCGELNRKSNYDRTLRFVASPATAKGMIVVPSAKGGPIMALKPNGHGDITHQADMHWWTSPRTPDVPSPLILNGLVYLCMENGDLSILRAETGEKLDYQRTHRDRHRSSPVYADGRIYLTARNGKTTVVKASEKVEVVAENELDEDISASPAISNGMIYLRTYKNLWAIKQQQAQQ